MKDTRDQLLAKQLIDYSTELQAGETVYIEIKGKDTLELGKQLIRIATERGANPFWFFNDESLLKQWLARATEEQFKQQAELHLDIMKRADAYIGVRGSDNVFELSDISQEQLERCNALFYKPVHLEERVKRTRWVVLRYPNASAAQLSEMSEDGFRDFYFDVCLADYSKMNTAQDKLKELMEETDQVRIVSPGTDLHFSIKEIPAIKCAGKLNIPDGEVFTAPVRQSVNGNITFNTPSLYQGKVYSDVSLRFENGRIIEASCKEDSKRLNKIFDTDEGARFVGEFAIGVNPFILHPMKDTLFDEKIAGSFHFTPGQCYDEAPNGNQSAIHWDLVQIQRPDYGGGEIWFDDKLIRKDGVFTDEKLERSFSADNLRMEREDGVESAL